MVASTAVSLVSIDVVRFILGIDAESTIERVESGHLRWVWNISADASGRRELRFLKSEVLGTSTPKSLEAAIAQAIGVSTCKRVRCSMLEILWTCSAQSVQRLIHNGAIQGTMEGHTYWIEVESLRRFLHQRLVS